jgi:two-component system chemotaxis sensor kinase CheA
MRSAHARRLGGALQGTEGAVVVPHGRVMWFFDRLGVRWKLTLLAGVPVLGVLLLSLLIARDAQQRAATAAGLGSIEDLARLTEQMTRVVHNLQLERAELAYRAGMSEQAGSEVAEQEQATEGALRSLDDFLATRDESKLPSKLARDLKLARERLAHLSERRAKSHQVDLEIDEHLEFYSGANDSLISATAALTQLTDDGEVLRSISRLVGAMQVIERRSREHALLSYVLAKGEFPPGTFRYFVTLLTEQDTYTAAIRTFESDEEYRRLQAALKGPRAEAIEAMRKLALQSDETLPVSAKAWFDTQNSNMHELFGVEQDLANAVRAATTKKVAETRHAVRLGIGLAGVVLVTSGLLAWAITRSLLRSVRVLSEAAEAVHQKGDFAIRATKISDDELGLLTDAFNGMLAGIQDRDGQLQQHRENLEALVEARTRELSERNLQMRLVLDNVEQGLVMIDREGKVLAECSRAFAESFGTPSPGRPFQEIVVKDDDEEQRDVLQLNYEQLLADFLPVEVALQQMPKTLVRGDRCYALSFTPVMREDIIDGALLMTRDITAELATRRSELAQRQKTKIFERIMRDRLGFFEFLAEARDIVDRLRSEVFHDSADKMRAIHTLKGNTAIFDVVSVSQAAHELECVLLDGEDPAGAAGKLFESWDSFIDQITPVLGEEVEDRAEVSHEELRQIISLVRAHAVHEKILHLLVRLRREPVRQRFQRIDEQLKALARRLGKPEPRVRIEANDVRLPVARFRSFWSSFAHVVRNIADHGMESERERAERGKARQNEIELCVRSDENALTIEIGDDGRGIDWTAMAAKAKEKNLPHATRAELVEALFCDGISTAAQVSEHSGRGVGMAAVLAACSAMNAMITVESEPGQGTRFRFVFPSIERDVIDADAEWTGPLSGHPPSLSASRPPPASLAKRPASTA